jgi:UDP-MurNAc hydroxylase
VCPPEHAYAPAVQLTSLGHACWLIEAAGLRLLCDPLLGVEHHGGVFEVCPRRRLRAEALRPDFILVSHRHPDHFDIPSLAELARHDADSVVVTPDELVASAARALGFRTVELLAPGHHVELDGVSLITTESLGDDEWGVMIASADGVVWNMVDTVFADVPHARGVTAAALAALGHSRVTLALVQGQPMLEIAAQLGHALSFPFRRYADQLDQLAAIDPAVIVPSAAGTVHAPAYAWLNAIVYPVDEARFRRDAAHVCPQSEVFESRLGARYRLAAGTIEREPDAGEPLFERLPGGVAACLYRPTTVPAPSDPHPIDAEGRAAIQGWIEHELRVALEHAYPNFNVTRPLRFVIEVVQLDDRCAWTLIVGPSGATVAPGFEPDWDVYDVVAGSLLADVIAGRRHWGDLLLSGALRGYSRAYELGPRGLAAANVGEMFLYYALSYDESTRRAVTWELGQAAQVVAPNAT